MNRKQYDEENIRKAIALAIDGKAGYLKAAKVCEVPRITLFQLCSNSSSGITTLSRKPVFPLYLEKTLVNYLLKMEQRFWYET